MVIVYSYPKINLPWAKNTSVINSLLRLPKCKVLKVQFLFIMGASKREAPASWVVTSYLRPLLLSNWLKVPDVLTDVTKLCTMIMPQNICRPGPTNVKRPLEINLVNKVDEINSVSTKHNVLRFLEEKSAPWTWYARVVTFVYQIYFQNWPAVNV